MAHTGEITRSTQISRVPYLPGLDGLRALAVLAVIVYHANSSWLPGGYLGVEVFFVISGYLITLLLVAESERTGAIELRQFWIRRARRLLPALFTMLVLLIFWTTFFERDALGKLRGDVIAGVLYGSNWFQVWIGAGYTAVNDFAPLRHLWSLAVEEQFYLLWPLVMLFVLRRGHDRLPRVAMWFVGVAATIGVAMAALMPTSRIGQDCVSTPGAYWEVAGRCVSKVDALYLSTPTRAMGLLLGAALALVWRPYALLRGPMKHKGPMLDPIAIIGIGIVALLVWKVHIVQLVGEDGLHADPWLFRGGLFLVGVATLMAIAAVAHKKAFAGRVIGNPVLRVIGERSYGLYLFHWPVFQCLRHETGIPLRLHEFVAAMIVTAVITEVSYRWIELPIRERRLRESMSALLRGGPGALRRRGGFGVIVSAAVLLPVFAGISLVTADVKPNAVQASLNEGEGSVTNVLEDLTTTTIPSESTTPTDSVVPVTTAAPPHYDVFAIGDSVMKGAAPALADLGIVVDAQQDRQARMGAEIFKQLEDLKVTIDVAVVHLGTNGPVSQETFDLLMDSTDQIPKVIILTLTANRDWTAQNNARIRALPETHPNVIVLDWQLVSELCTGKCFTADGIHLERDGMRFYAEEIWKAMGRELPSDW